jgi:N-acetylneuraminate lyase
LWLAQLIARRTTVLDIKGIIPALITPSDENGGLSLDALPGLLAFLLQRQVHGLFVGGSTGEGFFLSLQERKQLLEEVVQVVDRAVPVIAHVGGMNFREVLELTEHAAKTGADAVSSVIPFYYPYGISEISDYYAALVRTSNLPLIAYALGHTASASLTPGQLLDRVLQVEGVYGVKFTYSDLLQMQKLQQSAPDGFRFYGGFDSLALPMFSAGVCGMIGSNYNSLPEVWLALYDAYLRSDMARSQALQKRLTYYMKTLFPIPPIARARFLLQLRGVQVGRARWPQRDLSKEEEVSLWRLWQEVQADPLLQTIQQSVPLASPPAGSV